LSRTALSYNAFLPLATYNWSMRLFRRPLFIIGLLLIGAGALSACASRPTVPDKVHVLKWDGIVNPIMARYVDRGLDAAERSQAPAVVLRLNTPGGLDSSMREIVQRIESSTVPVIVYVSPAGGRAASAGTFITMVGHIAAMAPNTTIGAATPISGDGTDIEGALGRKVINDAVAYIRGIAELRDRNADWAERAVRDAAAVNQNEAVALNVVDFVATDVFDALTQANGREVRVAGPDGIGERTITLQTADRQTFVNNPNIFENLLYLLASPDIAFLLLTLGGLALLIEIINPGFGIGIFGVIALILAYFSLGALPVNWAGVALIALGILLLGFEIFMAGFGAFGIGGIAAIIFGGLILTGSSEVGFQVSRWLVIATGVIVGGFFLLVAGAILRVRKMTTKSGREAIVGAKGFARVKLDPTGYVVIDGERWEAIADQPPIEAGRAVVVLDQLGLRLKVAVDPAYAGQPSVPAEGAPAASAPEPPQAPPPDAPAPASAEGNR
jgi:membrane-bound serine protease (ClpP class)